MNRTKENMFEKRFQFALALLLKGNDTYIDVGKLHYRGATAKRLYERLKSTLDLMGITYYNAKGSMRMRVPKPKELEDGTKMKSGWNPAIDATWLQHIQGIQIKRPVAMTGIVEMKSGMSYSPTGRRAGKSTMAQMINPRPIKSQVMDDMIDALRTNIHQQMLTMDNEACEQFFGSYVARIWAEELIKKIDADSFANYMGYKKRGHP